MFTTVCIAMIASTVVGLGTGFVIICITEG